MERPLGIGVIGLGSAGARHARALLSGSVEGATLAAVFDPLPERAAELGVPVAPDAAELAARPDVAAVVIAAPHPSHAELARLALRTGRHVLVEKPLGLHKAECERLLAVHAALGPERPLLGVVHDYRADPRFVWLKALLGRGELGRVERVVWQATDFFRTDAYYRGSPWRGRFETEGGGVLVNQAPHLLDTIAWLLGAPRRVVGLCRFGRFHDVEVEDDVTAQLEFASGATALVVAATGEAPGTNRLEISGDRGRVVIEQGVALVHRNREPASVHRRRETSGRPLADVERIEFAARASRGAVLANFVAAIRGLEPLLAPADEAIVAVEVANAVLWSSLLERAVELPIDAAGFSRVHDELRARSSRRAESG